MDNKKKYVLKNQKEIEKSADGTENAEHIFDMIERAELCYGNIQDNTDLCVNLFKIKKVDEDESDALQLLCEDCIIYEKRAGELMGEIDFYKDKISHGDSVKEEIIEEILKEILIIELHSKDVMEKMVKNN